MSDRDGWSDRYDVNLSGADSGLAPDVPGWGRTSPFLFEHVGADVVADRVGVPAGASQ